MNKKKYLGVDWGEKRVGLAFAEEELSLALPLRTVSDLKELLFVIDSESITDIVIGSPRKMSGQLANNPLWLEFIENLKLNTKVNLHFIDERLTSLAADARGGRDKNKANRDEIAAAIILQDYLDKEVKN
jgi:putative Holliday junction resolvase